MARIESSDVVAGLEGIDRYLAFEAAGKEESVIPAGALSEPEASRMGEVEGSASRSCRYKHSGRKADSSTPLRFGRKDTFSNKLKEGPIFPDQFEDTPQALI